jgi:DNA polymerase-1
MKDDKDALYLLDGYSLIYRSYFAFINRPLLNSSGFNTSAVFGFFRSLTSMFETYNPKLFGVILDSSVPTFRHEMYPEYKANREKAPDDLHAQVPVIQEVLKAMNIKSVRMDGYEADDIMAYFARKCAEEGRPCYIITGDKDLLQLVGNGIKIMRPDKGDYQILDESDVAEVWGVRPDQIIDYLALCGDSADNIPGVKGVGPKTAVKLLADYGTLDGIYENIGSLSAGNQKKLESDRENAYLSRKLVKLADDFGVDLAPDVLSTAGLDKVAGAEVLYREEVTAVADRLTGKTKEKKQAPKQVRIFEPGQDSVFTGISGLGSKYGISSEDGSYEAVSSIDEL